VRTEPLPLFRRALADSWRSLIGWSLGVAAALSLYLPLFPSIGGSKQMQELIDNLPKQLVESLSYDQISTGAGYTQSTFYGLIGFALITIAAVSWGTAAIAGDEENGSLELTLAHGVTRTQVVLERLLAIVVRLLWLTVLAAAIVLALNSSAKLELDAVNVLAISAAWFGLALVTATFGLAVGALTGRRIFATSAAAGIAVVGYVLNAVSNQSDDLDWLHRFSPYAWAFHESPLVNGADRAGLALLYGLSLLFAAVAVVALRRRDIAG